MKRYYVVAICVFLLVTACQNKPSENKNKFMDVAGLGAKVFKEKCVICHGADGKLGLNGAKDLTLSIKSDEEKIIQIKKGKGAMTAFEHLLTEDEIKAVVKHINKFK